MNQKAEGAGQPEALGEILRAASAGEAEAWAEVVRLYSGRVFALAKSRCRNVDVAEDITQSVFTTVAAKLGSGEYVEQGRFESWLFRVVMNRVRDHIRKVRRRPEESTQQMDTRAARPERSDDESAMCDRLRAALERLPEADREVVELRHHGGLSFNQIAEMLGEPLGTLLARHHRALKKLREIMESAQTGTEVRA